MAIVQFQGNPIEVETVNFSGHLFCDFYAAKSPLVGPGWYIMGRNSEKYGPRNPGGQVMTVKISLAWEHPDDIRNQRTVVAQVSGGLAVHRSTVNPDYWRVSHVASGMSIPILDCRLRRVAVARRDRLLQLPVDWTQASPAEPGTTAERDLYAAIHTIASEVRDHTALEGKP